MAPAHGPRTIRGTAGDSETALNHVEDKYVVAANANTNADALTHLVSFRLHCPWPRPVLRRESVLLARCLLRDTTYVSVRRPVDSHHLPADLELSPVFFNTTVLPYTRPCVSLQRNASRPTLSVVHGRSIHIRQSHTNIAAAERRHS